ncbi:site-2 protease family protein [Candidatus Entotheonella serta]|nr:site-2 protease family protein [Candidatus Entotheonella serta]
MWDPLFLIPFIPVFLLALTLHEFGHAWTALKFGDPTAKLQGRVTLDPLKHLDLMGTICMFILQFGWAKPVPVNPANFRPDQRRQAELWVSLAGIIANLLQAVAYAAVWRVLLLVDPNMLYGLPFLQRFLLLGVLVNLALAIFNLLPVYPLDGAHVMKNLLPLRQAIPFVEFSQRYGAMILLGLILVGSFSSVSPLAIIIGVPRNWLAGILLPGF